MEKAATQKLLRSGPTWRIQGWSKGGGKKRRKKYTHTHTHLLTHTPERERGNGTQAVSSPPASSLLQINNQPQIPPAPGRSLTVPSDQIKSGAPTKERARDPTRSSGEPRNMLQRSMLLLFCNQSTQEGGLETAPAF